MNTCPETCATGGHLLLVGTCGRQNLMSALPWPYRSLAEGCSLTLARAAGRSEWPSRSAPAGTQPGQNW